MPANGIRHNALYRTPHPHTNRRGPARERAPMSPLLSEGALSSRGSCLRGPPSFDDQLSTTKMGPLLDFCSGSDRGTLSRRRRPTTQPCRQQKWNNERGGLLLGGKKNGGFEAFSCGDSGTENDESPRVTCVLVPLQGPLVPPRPGSTSWRTRPAPGLDFGAFWKQ